MSKKVLAIIGLFLLLFQSIGLGLTTLQPTTTLQPATTKNLKPATTKNLQPTVTLHNNLAPTNIAGLSIPRFDKIGVGSLAINTKPLSNKFVIELDSITSSNAGKVLNRWTVTDNFNKNFVVRPKGTNYSFLVMKLDRDGLQKALKKTNFLQQTYNKYKNKYSLGTLTIQTPTLERLPDRLRLKSKVIIKFKTKTELENIKRLYKLNINDIGLKNAIQLKTTKFDENKTIPETTIQKDMLRKCLTISKCYTKLEELSGKTKTQLSSYLSTRNSVLPSEVVDAMTKMIEDETEESIIEETEIIDISLLPVNVFSENNFNFNLQKKPSAVRIKLNQIKSSFKKLKKFMLIQKSLIQILPTETADKQLQEICNKYSGMDKNVCLSLADAYLNPKSKEYKKLLINGFTLGNEYSVSYESERHKRGRDIYYINLTLSVGYGFGVRIPIEAKIRIDNSVIPVNVADKQYRADITIKTKDATEQEYQDAGIPESKLFDGKEFVFAVYSYLDVNLDIMEYSVLDKKIDLIKLLGELIGIEGLESIDYSKDFTPPYLGNNTIDINNFINSYLGNNTVELVNKLYSIEICKKGYGIGGGTLYGDLNFKAYIDGYIKTLAQLVNSKWSNGSSSDKSLTFSSSPSKTIYLTAIKNTADKETDLIGTYNNYGLVLKEFEYIPQIVALIRARGRLHVRRDLLLVDGSKDISTPYYEIYKFKINLPSLGAHEGVNEENKKIEATDNKIYHNLKEDNQIGNYIIQKFNPQFYKPDLGNVNTTEQNEKQNQDNENREGNNDSNNSIDSNSSIDRSSCKSKPLRVLNKLKAKVVQVLQRKSSSKLKKIYGKVNNLISIYSNKTSLTKKEKLILNVVYDVKDIMECYSLTGEENLSEEEILKNLLK